jgi:hypothetical protein
MVTVLYYLLVALISALLVYTLARSKSWLYVIVLVPFLLRLFRLK